MADLYLALLTRSIGSKPPTAFEEVRSASRKAAVQPFRIDAAGPPASRARYVKNQSEKDNRQVDGFLTFSYTTHQRLIGRKSQRRECRGLVGQARAGE